MHHFRRLICFPGRSRITDRADRELRLAWPSAIRPIGLRDDSIELDRLRSRSAYQAQSSRPPSGFATLGRLGAAHLAARYVSYQN